jgi:hypothetical integral membrane protein (TIGR02206 family)
MFELFGTSHYIGLLLTIIWAIIMYNIANKEGRYAQAIATVSGYILLTFYPIFLYFRLQASTFDVVYHLPLQISNLILVFLGLSLIINSKFWYAMAMFWAFPGGLVSVLLPDIRNPFPHQDYFFFWISHAVLIGYCVFLYHYRTFTLSVRDAINSLGVLLLYVVTVYPLNVRLESNYGYLNELPPSLTLPPVLQMSQNYIPVFFVLVAVLSYLVLKIHSYFDTLNTAESVA